MGRLTMDLYIKQLSTRYRQASKKEKGLMLDEYCATSHHTRKHAIKTINKAFKEQVSRMKPIKKKPGRKPVYNSKSLTLVLKNIWLATDQMCGKRLKSALPLWLPHYEKHYEAISSDDYHQLEKISSATIDRLLSPFRVIHNKGRSGTKPGTLLKTQIPILTEQWDTAKPGFVEADTVAHCGTSLSGEFIWSLTLTDIFSGWTELRAVWGKGAIGIVNQIKEVESILPFTLRGFDSDNGSEFLNYHLLRYFACPEDENKLRLQFTRSRPYKKNDNAHVEQKNWTHVRQLLGYHRLDNIKLLPLINQLYANEVSDFNNFFCPNVKLIAKERIQSKIKKTHSKAATPYKRLLSCSEISTEKKNELIEKFQALDPFVLQKSIQQQLKIIFNLIDPCITKQRVAI